MKGRIASGNRCYFDIISAIKISRLRWAGHVKKPLHTTWGKSSYQKGYLKTIRWVCGAGRDQETDERTPQQLITMYSKF